MARRARSIIRIAPDGAKAAAPAQSNLLVSRLPENEVALLLERGEQFTATLRQQFFELNEPIEKVYFPLTGMASLVTVLKDGTSLEGMTVGREGFVGLPLFHGIKRHRCECMCQIDGDFLELGADDFLEIIPDAPKLQQQLHIYSQFAHEVLTQSAACNGTHLVEQRCARWLLSTADAVGRTSFNLTQEFLSQMLAVRRPGVTVAVGTLVRQGLISHRYGAVSILDVTGLKHAACECYGTIKESAQELFG
jgi:CRP-like cAMP-binding protein